MNRRGIRGIASTLATLVVFLSVSVTADAAQPKYVALGDSYASGNGAGSYLSDGTSCYRTLKAYPGLIATGHGLALDLQACSGANIADVLSRQLGAVDTSTAYVTITVGGNDIGFASVLTTCLGTNTTACLNAVAKAVSTAKSAEFKAALVNVYSTAKNKASPGAKVVATSYPRLFNGKDCSVLTSFTSTEMTKLNEGADILAASIAEAAKTAGISYADVRGPFVGHAVCDRSPWILNASLWRQYESFHPNATGHSSGYRPTVASTMGVTGTTGTTATVTTGGQTSSDTNRGTVKVPKS